MKAAEGPARHNLPCEMSSFVGREQQLAELARHVNRSLVVAEPAAEETVRYRLLETLRQYAQGRLTERGELGRTRSRLKLRQRWRCAWRG